MVVRVTYCASRSPLEERLGGLVDRCQVLPRALEHLLRPPFIRHAGLCCRTLPVEGWSRDGPLQVRGRASAHV